MFSHESIPLISFFIIMLLCVLAAVLHPVHAFVSWVNRRKRRATLKHTEQVRKLYSR
ncbi:hypothetical protein QF019_000309 [Pseudomonas frederiksbergensis]